MSESGQQRVMLRSDYGRASGFRHGAMLCRQGTSSLLYFVYTLLSVTGFARLRPAHYELVNVTLMLLLDRSVALNFTGHTFDTILNALHDGVYITDGAGITVKVNSAYERLTGLQSGQLIGRSMHDLVRDGVVSQSASLRVLQQGAPVSVMQSLGNGKKLLVSATPIFENRRISFVVSAVRDMTELLRMKHERDELAGLKKLRQSTAQLHAGEYEKLAQSSLVFDLAQTGSLFAQARRVAGSDVKVLLLGEAVPDWVVLSVPKANARSVGFRPWGVRATTCSRRRPEACASSTHNRSLPAPPGPPPRPDQYHPAHWRRGRHRAWCS